LSSVTGGDIPDPAPRMVVAMVGFGDLGSRWAKELAAQPALVVRAYLPADAASRRSGLAERRAGFAGVTPDDRLEPVLAGAGLVIAAVPSAASARAAAACAPLIEQEAVYVDPSSAAPETKAQNAEVVGAAGALYVDAAVLGTATLSGLAVPLLAAGPGALRLAEIAARIGMDVMPAGLVPGDAARAKLIRSVYMKGRDALLVEMLAAAETAGVRRLVVESIARAPGEQVTFNQLVERVLPALSLHAERRADELRDAIAVLDLLGVSPEMTRAAAERLRAMAAIEEIRLMAGADRAPSADEVAAALARRPAQT
jgi:3-hydroxyisobutyrate dehydrogenase-like beta-hydroxyacid dehydrogenase